MEFVDNLSGVYHVPNHGFVILMRWFYTLKAGYPLIYEERKNKDKATIKNGHARDRRRTSGLKSM